jgi:hypothetical protein
MAKKYAVVWPEDNSWFYRECASLEEAEFERPRINSERSESARRFNVDECLIAAWEGQKD